MPAELLDPDILDRIPHRVRLRRFGSVSFRETAKIERPPPDRGTTDAILPVINETRTRIRIAFQDDNARLALWIPRDDTATVIGVQIELADRDGVASVDAGVWTKPGAPVVTGEHARGLTEVRIPDDAVTIKGYVPDPVLTNVWVAAAGDPPPSFDVGRSQLTPRVDTRTHVRFVAGTAMRRAPTPNAPVIATVDLAEVVGMVMRDVGEYRQIELFRRYARIVGYVPLKQVTFTQMDLTTYGHGSGHGFGMSHADKIDLPAGTCLFDEIAGEVVGVQSEPSTRHGTRKVDVAGWSRIYIGTSWITAQVYVRDTSTDPAQPKWESCTQATHR